MNGGDIEPTDIVEDAPIAQIITEDFIAQFEKQAELYQNRYLPVCLKLTNEADWVSHGKGRYFLQCSGAEKLCNPLGISWDRPAVTKHERSDTSGSFYEYEVEGIVRSKVLQRSGWFTGNCDSRDQFFNARGNFSEGDIRKSAFSNWLVNSVTRLAGIRNPTQQMLKKAGLNTDQISSIDYRGDKTPEESNAVISEAQAKRIWAIAKQHGVDEKILHEIVARDPWKYASLKEIKRGHYDALVKAVENYKPEEKKAGGGTQEGAS